MANCTVAVESSAKIDPTVKRAETELFRRSSIASVKAFESVRTSMRSFTYWWRHCLFFRRCRKCHEGHMPTIVSAVTPALTCAQCATPLAERLATGELRLLLRDVTEGQARTSRVAGSCQYLRRRFARGGRDQEWCLRHIFHVPKVLCRCLRYRPWVSYSWGCSKGHIITLVSADDDGKMHQYLQHHVALETLLKSAVGGTFSLLFMELDEAKRHSFNITKLDELFDHVSPSVGTLVVLRTSSNVMRRL